MKPRELTSEERTKIIQTRETRRIALGEHDAENDETEQEQAERLGRCEIY